MKIRSEAKFGIIGIVTIVVLIWGINYLKGRNILKSTYTLYAFYPDAGGLETSAPVTLNGMKIGYVHNLKLLPGEENPVEAILHIEKGYPLSRGTRAILYSSDLIGTKAIRMEERDQEGLLEDQDTLNSVAEKSLAGELQARLMPFVDQAGHLVATADSILKKLDATLETEELQSTMADLTAAASSLRVFLARGGSLDMSARNLESFSGMLNQQKEHISSISGDLASITHSLDSADLGNLIAEVSETAVHMKRITDQLARGEGSAGKLLYDDSLYLNLQVLVSDLDLLVRDLQEHPEDYVRFSVFGNKKEGD